MTKKSDYNLLVIGGGSAGLVCANTAATLKAKVILFEKESMGGDCLNTGCVPSKALIKVAKVRHLLQTAARYGLENSDANYSFEKVMEHIRSIIGVIEPNDSMDRYTKMGVHCVRAGAEILSPSELRAGDKIYRGKNMVIATGARPNVPAIPGLKEAPYYTSETIWGMSALPKKLLILGGGAIGCELAQSFHRLGAKVTLVERNSALLNKEDSDVSAWITSYFAKCGIEILLRADALEIEKNNGDFFLKYKQGGEEKQVEFDALLIALGRRPRTQGLGLETIGVKLRPNGTVATDEYQRTNVPGVYACGDVCGPYQFTHFAAEQAWRATANALLRPWKKFSLSYESMPWTTFTDPEISRVGFTEEDLKVSGKSFDVFRYDLKGLDRAIVEGEAEGFIKVIAEKNTGKILGVHYVGTRASEGIMEFVAAMKSGKGLQSLLSAVHPYPSFTEANKFAAGIWKRQSIPAWAPAVLRRYHELARRF